MCIGFLLWECPCVSVSVSITVSTSMTLTLSQTCSCVHVKTHRFINHRRVTAPRYIHQQGVKTPWCIHHRGVVLDTRESFYRYLRAYNQLQKGHHTWKQMWVNSRHVIYVRKICFISGNPIDFPVYSLPRSMLHKEITPLIFQKFKNRYSIYIEPGNYLMKTTGDKKFVTLSF